MLVRFFPSYFYSLGKKCTPIRFFIMLNNINRRKFVTSTAASAAGILIGSHLKGMAVPAREREEEEKPSAKSKYDIMKEVMKYRKIDTPAHIYFTDNSPGRATGLW